MSELDVTVLKASMEEARDVAERLEKAGVASRVKQVSLLGSDRFDPAGHLRTHEVVVASRDADQARRLVRDHMSKADARAERHVPAIVRDFLLGTCLALVFMVVTYYAAGGPTLVWIPVGVVAAIGAYIFCRQRPWRPPTDDAD